MIENKTKGTVLAIDQVYLMDAKLSRGLMFHKRIFDKGYIFVFPTEGKWLIHMFFVFFKLDILWLDKNYKVIDLKRSIWPFSIHTHKGLAKFVIEVEPNAIDNSNTTIGDFVTVT
jgi:uncharacterized membrane protein (UPF0127 family)